MTPSHHKNEVKTVKDILQDFYEHSYMAGVRNEHDDESPQKFTIEQAEAAIQKLLIRERINERNIERQELLGAYRLTAHNSGFGRQLANNLAANARRIATLEQQLQQLEGKE